MKILVFADLHDDDFALEKLKEISKNYDYIFICGDISGNNTYVAKKIVENFPNAYIIPGNNENSEILEILKGMKNFAHKRVFKFENYKLIGFGYSNLTPFKTPGELSEEKIYEELSSLPIDNNTILLLHVPPYQIFDNVKDMNVGSTSVRKVIDEKKPLLVICAHIHEHSGFAKVSNSFILKVGAAIKWKYATLYLNQNEIKVYFEEIKG